ncbi:MAG TPA: hypothetical protein VHO69_13115 [Phototrophicaceae bacterium]|nr:hypothetical protein [Phototrophicaceae bacterium]
MEFPDGQTPADILEYSAVKLFLQSARRTQPDFELQAADLPPVARICSLVGGMPLGILLAASWVGVLSLPEIADEIARNLDFLETSLRDIPERQRSIRAVFDYSWSLLTEAERQVFMKTSVFRGGFMREAAQQVAGASLQHLISLVGKSLLRRNPKTGRYEIHELLRQYAAEQLDRAGETDATRKAASVYYAAFLQQREADLKGRRQVAALDEIELDFPNVRRAWKWAVEQRNLTQLRQMLNGLNIYCDMRSRLVEGFDLFQRAIQPFENATDDDQQYVRNLINVRLIRGQVLATAWNKTEAAAHAALDLCLQQAQVRQDRPEIAYCLWTRAITYAFLGDEQTNVASGVTAAEAFLDASRELGDKFYIAEALVWVGVFYLLLGQKETAITYTRQGLDIKNQIGDQHGVSYILYNLSVNLFEGEQYIEAEAYARESVQCMAETRSQKGMTISNFQLAWVLFFKGELAEARQLTEQIIEVSKQIHFPHGELQARFLFAMLLAIMDEQYLEAKCQCDEQQAAIPFYNTGGASYAIVACGLGNYEAARQHHQTVLRNNRFSKSFLGISLALEVLIHAHQGQPERAIEFLGLVSTWPERISGWMNAWPLLTRQRELLATELGTEAYQQAWNHGQELDAEQVWAELLRL